MYSTDRQFRLKVRGNDQCVRRSPQGAPSLFGYLIRGGPETRGRPLNRLPVGNIVHGLVDRGTHVGVPADNQRTSRV